MWSDPCNPEEEKQNDPAVVDWAPNRARDCSYHFGIHPVKALLRREKLLSVIRAHEVKLEGYEMHLWEGADQFPLVITVFSAPNYQGAYNNRAAILLCSKDEPEALEVRQFDESKDIIKPYSLPNNMDVFSWSAPFLCECVSQMFYSMLSQHNEIYDREEEKDKLDEQEVVTAEINNLLKRRMSTMMEKKSKIQVLRHKIRFVGRMARIWTVEKKNR